MIRKKSPWLFLALCLAVLSLVGAPRAQVVPIPGSGCLGPGALPQGMAGAGNLSAGGWVSFTWNACQGGGLIIVGVPQPNALIGAPPMCAAAMPCFLSCVPIGIWPGGIRIMLPPGSRGWQFCVQAVCVTPAGCLQLSQAAAVRIR